ncbi:MAG: glucose-6-phosphate dehydrogenase, partial [Clostridia bacterium]
MSTPTTNPLREGLSHVTMVSPFVMVIFGAGGDLTRRKLIPAVYNLMLDGLLPREMAIVGFSRGDDTDESFRKMARAALEEFSRRPVDEDVWRRLEPMLHFVGADFGDQAAYRTLSDLLDRLDREEGCGGNRIFYCATPPSQYPVIAEQLGAAGLNRPHSEQSYVRLVVEKPFGHDTASAVALNQHLHDVFQEQQIYRLDHYLGKETVQNILVFRFGNGIFEPVWNRQYVDHVQITVAESIGVGTRGGYYDQAGAARDMLQNHLMQLL